MLPARAAIDTCRQVFGIGRNYAEHARELGNSIPREPVVFLKSPNSLRTLTEGELAFAAETFHFEAEILVRVGVAVPLGQFRPGMHVLDGVGLGIDLTRRQVQQGLKEKGLPWTLAKSFAGSGLISDLLPPNTFQDLKAISFFFELNGQRCQSGNSAQMIFSIDAVLSYLNSFNALGVGDLIFTGTPEGVGPIKKGDVFTLAFTTPEIRFSGRL